VNRKVALKARVLVHEAASRLGMKTRISSKADPNLLDHLSKDARERGVTPEMVISAVSSHPQWWHTISLPYGVKTPGRVREDIQDWITQAIPDDLTGKTVLDIGAWDGYYSFAAERRGASVLAIDDGSNWGGGTGFDVAKKVLGSKVEFETKKAEDVDTLNKTFDVVLFLGVYYHLKNPLLVFEKLAKVTNQLLIVEGHFIAGGRKPLMRFYPTNELGHDTSNWWAANESCLVQMLKVSGFRKVACVDKLRDFKGGGRILLTAWK